MAIAAVSGGAGMGLSQSAHADDDATQLRNEVDQLKKALAESQKQLEEQRALQGGGTATSSPAIPATPPGGAAEAVGATGAAPGSAAEETSDLGKVVVQAPNRLAPLQDVPLSVSVVTGQQLQQNDAFDIVSILKRTSDVTWNQGNQRTSSLSIRGIGKIGQTEAQDPSVGVVVDGVNYAFNPLTSSVNFTDLDTVQVTRGPQGTAGGKNNSLGQVEINSRAPSFTPDAEYLLYFGKYNTLIGQASGGGAAIDDLLAFRATISVEKGQGDMKNLYTTDQTYQNLDRTTGRFQLLFTPVEQLNAKLSINVQPQGGEYTNNRIINTQQPSAYSNGAQITAVTPQSRLTRSWFTQDPNYNYKNYFLNGAGQFAVDIDGGYPLETATYGGSLQVNWTPGPFTVTSITGYQNYTFDARNDEGTPFAVSTTGGVYDNDYWQLSQELRISGSAGKWADYQAGVYLDQTSTSYNSYSNWLQDAGAWYASNAQYASLNADSNGRYLLQNSLNGMFEQVTNNIRNKAAAAFAQVTWHITDPLSLVTGIRETYENRRNSGFQLLSDQGNGRALNPVAVNGVQLGGYASNNTTGALLGTNTATQLALANAVAQQYFNAASYSALSAGQLSQLAAAKTLRQTQIGVLWNPVTASSFNRILPSLFLSPSYKINQNATVYASYQLGEKAGVSQIVQGLSYPVQAEKTDAYEIGLKSNFFEKTLTFNIDYYLMDIHNYQQAVQVFSAYTTALNANGQSYYVSALGNAPWVRSEGFEVDSAYSGIRNLTVRLSGAYTNAFYEKFPNAGQPVERANAAVPYYNAAGQTLPGASRWIGDLGAQYRFPLGQTRAMFAGFDSNYQSRYNSDAALSSYGWIGGGVITDANIGISLANGRFDVSLVSKNVTNNKLPVLQTWNNNEPAFSRTWGIQFAGKLL
jgi:iron complex outermembrane recepter protein